MAQTAYHLSSGLGIGRVAHLIDLAPTILSREEREENLAAIDQSPWCESTPPPVDWDIDDRMFSLAERIASGSHCLAAQVGAVLVRDGRVLMARCNDAPDGIASCLEQGCVVIPATATAHEQSRHSHAEEALIAGCANQGIRTAGASLYVTLEPCLTCARQIIRAGVKEVVIRTAPEAWAASVGAFLKQGGVAVRTVE